MSDERYRPGRLPDTRELNLCCGMELNQPPDDERLKAFLFDVLLAADKYKR